jgi:hypothetical protein
MNKRGYLRHLYFRKFYGQGVWSSGHSHSCSHSQAETLSQQWYPLVHSPLTIVCYLYSPKDSPPQRRNCAPPRPRSAVPPSCSSWRPWARRPASPPRQSAAARLPPSPSRLLPAATFSSAWTTFLHRSGDISCQIYHGILYRSNKLCATSELYTGELHMLRSLDSPTQQEDVALKVHVAKVCFKCFKCFRGMLQVFQMDVAKIDLDVAHVAIAIHVCCKSLFKIFHLF